MDFHTLPRRDLQALCKKNRIPANLTNAAMADALGALPTVEGMDEPSQFQSPQKPEILSPDLPRTGRRTAARRAAPAPTPPPVAPEDPREGQASPLPRARRVSAKAVAAEEEATEPEKADTPVARTGRKPRVLPTPVTRPTTRTRASKQAATPATGTTGLKTKVVEVAPTPATGTTGLKTKKSSVKKTEEPSAATVNTGRSSRGRAAAKMTSLLQETATAAATANTGRRSTRLRGVGKMASLLHEPDEPEGKEAIAQVGEESDLCPSEPQAEIIDSEKQMTVSEIKKCQPIQEPVDPTPVEENVEGNLDSNSKSQPLDSTPVEEKAEGDGDLNTESEIVEEIQEPAEDFVEGAGDSKSESEIKECQEVEPDSALRKENDVNLVSETKKGHEIQDPLDSAPVEEKNVEDGAVSESEIIECQAVQVQEPLGSAAMQENVEDGVVSESEIKEGQEVQVQEPLCLAPVEENLVEDGVVSESENMECQEVQAQESLESAPVEDNGEGGVNPELEIKEFQEVQVQEPLELTPVEDNCEDGANSESDIKKFQEVQEPLESAPVDDEYSMPVSDDSPVWGLVDEPSREEDVVEQSVDSDFHSDVSPAIAEVFGDLSPINEAFEDSPPPSDAVAEDEAEITVVVLDTTIEAVDNMVQTKEHFEEQLTVIEVAEHAEETETTIESDSIGILSASPAINVSEPFMAAEAKEHSDEQLEVSEAVVEHFVEHVAGVEVKQFIEEVAVDSKTTKEFDTTATFAISLINEVAGGADLHQQEPKAPANVVEKEPELSSDVATDNDGGDCDDKENNGGEAKGKKPIRRHVVYSKLSMRKLKAILKERLAVTAKNSNTGEGKKVEAKRTALRALDENQL